MWKRIKNYFFNKFIYKKKLIFKVEYNHIKDDEFECILYWEMENKIYINLPLKRQILSKMSSINNQPINLHQIIFSLQCFIEYCQNNIERYKSEKIIEENFEDE